MNGWNGDGTDCFTIKVGTYTANMTNTRIARFGQGIYLLRESEALVEDKTNVASRVDSSEWAGEEIQFQMSWELRDLQSSMKRYAVVSNAGITSINNNDCQAHTALG